MSTQQAPASEEYRCPTWPDRIVVATNIHVILVNVGGTVYRKWKCPVCGCMHKIVRVRDTK